METGAIHDSGFRREEDDGHELQLAAMERVPAYKQTTTSPFDRDNCVNTTTEDQENGNMMKVDVPKLGVLERRALIDKLLNKIEEDNHKLLLKQKRRLERVGLEYPTVEAVANIIWRNSLAYKIKILKEVHGIIRPSRMTLLLGHPGCGKSTLLLALAGKLDPSLKVSGTITYNGYNFNEFVPQKTSAYISQHDRHTSEMTVRETLDFAARCQGIGSRADIKEEVCRREKQAGIIPEPDIDTYMREVATEGLKETLQTDYILKILGLDACADTMVGDAMRRGISGGQKKRLTTGEMLIGPAKVLLMDEISNGRTIYHGPKENVLEFFESCGFRCPPRKSIADFLQEVVSIKDQGQYWKKENIEEPYIYISAQDFERKFRDFYVGKNLDYEISHPTNKTEIQKIPSTFKTRSVKNWELFRACMAREWLLMKRNSFVHVFKSVQLVVTAIITMTVFILLTYYVIGYTPEPERFFCQLLLLFVLHQVSISSFRLLATMLRNPSFAVSCSLFSMLVMFLLCGFIIPQSSLPAWLQWGFWLSPITYAEISISTNEFLAPRWKKVLSTNATIGQAVLTQHGLNYSANFYWISIGALVGFWMVLNVGFTFALTWLKSPGRSRTIISQESISKPKEGCNLRKLSKNSMWNHVSYPQAPVEVKQLGMVLPFEPVTLTFQNVQYYVNTPMKMKEHGFEEKSLLKVKKMNLLKKTIVCTIHQPSINIFEAFDELLLMKRGGQIIYAGPLGPQSSKLIEYFEGIPGVPKLQENSNPATWMLQLTSTSTEVQLGLDFGHIYKRSHLYGKMVELVKELSYPVGGLEQLKKSTCFSRNGWEQFQACLWKQNLSYWRSPNYNLVRLTFITVVSLLLGGLLWQKGNDIDDEQDLLNILGTIYIFVLFLGIANCSSVQSFIATDRAVVWRERFAGMYSSLAHSLAQVVIEIPYLFLQAFIFVIITYPAIGFYWSVNKVFWYFYTTFCTVLYFTYLGMFLYAITPSLQVASILATFSYTILSLFSGFLIPGPQMPKWWVWCYWLCPSAWSLRAILTSQYGDISKEIQVFGEKKAVNAFLANYFGYHHKDLSLVASVLCVLPLVFASAYAYFMARLNFQKR
ncbi:hypothetical protein POM88_022731 [Heracleum sosnowskyi]|uniref:ABC transporter domain-containing protein n=1 Tax=Heracleum sosnowskyi TaxID=360622 RepID=A0AAD8IGC6_9APIA|nr:hypothetical protein POM88_022731 [Heracleum sosnowskyi]